MAVEAECLGIKQGSIFAEEEFWYKIDVDWEEAQNEFVGGDDEDLDKESSENESPDNFAEALLLEFSKGKTSIIEAPSEYDTIQKFVADIQGKESDEAKDELLRLYVRYQWSLKRKEDEYSADDINGILTELSGDGPVVRERINSDYEILWPGDSQIDKQVEEGQVAARKLLKTSPVIVKKQEEAFVIRGESKSRSKITDRLNTIDSAKKSEPEHRAESISEEVSTIITQTEGSFRDNFKIIDAQYNESGLPGRSQLKIKNEQGIHQDLQALRNDGYLSAVGMSGLSWFRVKDIVNGGRYKITLTHRSDGFMFDSSTGHKTDDEREDFESRFARITDVDFDTIYEYGAADDRFLLNRILKGSYEAYENYYDKLSTTQQEFLDKVLVTDDGDLDLVEKKECEECGHRENPKEDNCEECGESSFSEPFPVETKIDTNSVASQFNLTIRDVEPSHPDIDFLSFNTQTNELRDTRVVEANVKMHRSPGGADNIRKREIYFAPLGDNQKLRRISDYLLPAAYITYGPSSGESGSGYGFVELYDLLFDETKNNSELIGDAIYQAVHSLEERVLEESRDAVNRGQKYISTAEEYDDLSGHEDELSNFYGSGNYFEKEVFYLLKSLFEWSERWGKENKRESDGAVILPREDADKFHILTYDSKLSFEEDGYSFTPAEEDQATRYILHDNDWELLKTKTGDEEIDAHIMVSQNFNSNHYSKMAENVRRHFDVFSGDTVKTEIAYLDFEALVELYEVKRRLYSYMSDGEFVKVFNRLFLEKVTEREDGELYSRITLSDIKQIDEVLTRRADEYSDEKLRPYSEDARDE